MTVDGLAQSLPSSIFLRGVTYREEMAPRWQDWLSEEERRCLASFGAPSRRHEFLAGRAAARQLLAGALEMSPGDVPLRRATDDGVDVGVPAWSVSIAHSDLHAIAACARHPIGVDLERIQPRDPGVIQFLFAPEDRGLVRSLPYETSSGLILCWSLKEAVLKARRSGFRTSPKDLKLDVRPQEETARVQVEGGDTWLVHFARIEDFWGAVALPLSESNDEAGDAPSSSG